MQPDSCEMMYEENSTPEEPEKISCLNCGAQITDRFCSHCGQDKNEFQKSIWQILVGFAASLFDLDGKIPSSFVPLLFKPGKLTLEFLEGKRKSQINPFQLYAFFSFIFFLTAFYLPNFTEKGNSKFETNVKFNPTKSVEGSLKTEDQPDSSFGSQVQKVCHEAVIEFGPKGLVHHYDSVQRGLPEDQRDGLVVGIFRKKMHAFGDRLAQDKTVTEKLLENMKENIPNTLIFLLPVFALILKLLYIRRPLHYVGHLILSIHLFCFLFFLGSLLFFINALLPKQSDVFYILGLIAVPVYFVLAMKRVYRQSLSKTIIKYGIASFCFVLISISAMILNFIFAALIQA